MTRSRIVFALLLVTGLAACKPRVVDTTPPVFQPPPEYGLAFNDDTASARLTFGAPNSDDVELIMSCYNGSGRIMVTDLWQVGAKVTAKSGAAQMAYEGITAVNQESSGSQADFWAHPTDPPLAAFRGTGELTLQSGKKVLPIKARPAEMAAVGAFFTACEKRSG